MQFIFKCSFISHTENNNNNNSCDEDNNDDDDDKTKEKTGTWLLFFFFWDVSDIYLSMFVTQKQKKIVDTKNNDPISPLI